MSPQGIMSRKEFFRIIGRQRDETPSLRLRALEVTANRVDGIESAFHSERSVRVAQPIAQLFGSKPCVFGLSATVSFERWKHLSHRDLQLEFVAVAIWSFRQLHEQTKRGI